MKRLVRRIVLGVAGLLTVGALAGAAYEARATRHDLAGFPPPGRLVDIGGHRLHIWCTGVGEPTVVLDTGLGGTAFDWGYVQPAVAKFTRVCSYDRSGMGYSDAGSGPRTTENIANELAALLDKSDIRRPVMLVGASVGAWNMRVFASMREERVAGLVLVDPRHELQGPRLAEAGAPENPPWIRWVTRLAPAVGYLGIARAAGFAPGPSPDELAPAVQEFARATRFRASAVVAAASELGHARESAEQVARSRRRLSVPLVVISAGQRRSSRVAGVLDVLQREHLELSSTASCQVIAADSGHAIMLGQPDIIVEAIRATFVATRANVPPDCEAVRRTAAMRRPLAPQ